jgi:hypothetical protein
MNRRFKNKGGPCEYHALARPLICGTGPMRERGNLNWPGSHKMLLA